MINRGIWERRWRFCDLLHSCFGRWLGRSSSHFGPCIKSVSDYLVRIYAAKFVCIVMKRISTSNEPLQFIVMHSFSRTRLAPSLERTIRIFILGG